MIKQLKRIAVVLVGLSAGVVCYCLYVAVVVLAVAPVFAAGLIASHTVGAWL